MGQVFGDTRRVVIYALGDSHHTPPPGHLAPGSRLVLIGHVDAEPFVQQLQVVTVDCSRRKEWARFD